MSNDVTTLKLYDIQKLSNPELCDALVAISYAVAYYDYQHARTGRLADTFKRVSNIERWLEREFNIRYGQTHVYLLVNRADNEEAFYYLGHHSNEGADRIVRRYTELLEDGEFCGIEVEDDNCIVTGVFTALSPLDDLRVVNP